MSKKKWSYNYHIPPPPPKKSKKEIIRERREIKIKKMINSEKTDVLLNTLSKLSEYFIDYEHPTNKEHQYKWHYVPSAFSLVIKTLQEFSFEELPDNPKILEIGCGIGVISNMLRLIIPDSSVDGIDINEKLIQVAETSFGRENVNFQVGDITKFKKKDIQQYDLIYVYKIYMEEYEQNNFEYELLSKMKNGSYLYSFDSSIEKLPKNCSFVHEDIILKKK